MECKNCGYYWQEDGEEHPFCHYTGIEAWAPCNQDEIVEYEREYW